MTSVPERLEAAACYRHTDRPTNIGCSRCGKPICPECMTPASVGFHCPDCVREGRRTVRAPTGRFGGRVATGAPVTYALIGINVVMFLITMGGALQVSSQGNYSSSFLDLALIGKTPPEFVAEGVANGEYYRLLTSCFLHFNLLHLGSNMLVLYFVGPALERIVGSARFSVIYLLGGLGGSVATYLFAAPFQITAGASGAIFGLFAALFVIGRAIRADLSGIVGTILVNLLITFTVPGISITGHVGGLIAGATCGLVITKAGRQRIGWQWAGYAAVLGALIIATAARTAALS